jgi:carbon starvation protein
VLQEFTGWRGRAGRLACTVLTLLPPLALVMQTITVTDPASGRALVVPAWKRFWLLFGTANQLLAALTLVGVTIWLLRAGRSWWYVAAPALFMMAVTLTSLSGILWEWGRRLGRGGPFDPNGPICFLLFALALFLLLEAVLAVRRNLRSRAAEALRRA